MSDHRQMESEDLCERYWRQRPILTSPSAGQDGDWPNGADCFGKAVAASHDGRILAVGAILEGYNGWEAAGTVRMYRWRWSWSPRATLLAGACHQDMFGSPLALSGDGSVVAVSCKKACGGQVTVFSCREDQLTQRGRPFAFGPGTGFSVSLDATGDTIAISSPFLSREHRLYTEGTVAVFTWNAARSTWEPRGEELFGASNSRPGTDVVLSARGDWIAIADVLHDRMRGRVRVYRWNGSHWLRCGRDLEGARPEDCFGQSIAMSGDGQTLIIGAYQNYDKDVGAGMVCAYAWTDSLQEWTLRGPPIYGRARGDNAGKVVAISFDGNVLAYSGAKCTRPDAEEAGGLWGQVRVRVWSPLQKQWIRRGSSEDLIIPMRSDPSICLSIAGRQVTVGTAHSAYARDGKGRVFVWDWQRMDASQRRKSRVDIVLPELVAEESDDEQAIH